MASSQFDAPSFMHDTLHAIEIDCLERRVVATLERIPNDESKVAVLRNVCDVFGVRDQMHRATAPSRFAAQRGPPRYQARPTSGLEAVIAAAEKEINDIVPEDDDACTWVQCEQCTKWRRLRLVTAADLPDVWTCSQGGLSCETQQEELDDDVEEELDEEGNPIEDEDEGNPSRAVRA